MGCALFLALAIAWGAITGAPAVSAKEQIADTATSEELPIAEIELLTEIYGRIKRDYVDEVDDERLFRAAIRGMLAELDAHSSYLEDEELKRLQQGTRGEFGGIGLELVSEGGFVEVVAPIDDTPASRAGLKSGDIITRVDGESIRGLELGEVVRKLRGEPGSRVEMTVVRDGEGEPLTFELERAIIQVESVRSRLLTAEFGYVRISQFQERTARDLHRALEGLKDEAEDRLAGLVLDLRNNPGGVLNSAIAVADAFLSDGLIVYTEGRVRQASMEFSASGRDRIDGVPLIVLINRGSASGSEIVAGSLQDRGRAIIMGQPSFGKGSVQSVVPLGGPAIKLTTARYYTPSGHSIDKRGVTPDITVEPLRLTESEGQEISAEAELKGRTPSTEEERDEQREALHRLAREDYMLYEALNLLKGLKIVEGR
ncbi:peptidase S41 [Halorhodospira abdelmalekii]|nr:peptidase S41 [Halorhodospira abdelmalekii]